MIGPKSRITITGAKIPSTSTYWVHGPLGLQSLGSADTRPQSLAMQAAEALELRTAMARTDLVFLLCVLACRPLGFGGLDGFGLRIHDKDCLMILVVLLKTQVCISSRATGVLSGLSLGSGAGEGPGFETEV